MKGPKKSIWEYIFCDVKVCTRVINIDFSLHEPIENGDENYQQLPNKTEFSVGNV